MRNFVPLILYFFTLVNFVAQKMVSDNSIEIELINYHVKPNENFFQFTNGNWIKSSVLPKSIDKINNLTELKIQTTDELICILDSFAKNPVSKGLSSTILGNFYASFVDVETRKKLGFTAIKEDIDQILSLKSKKEIPVLLAKHHIYGSNSLFNFYLDENFLDTKNFKYYVNQDNGLFESELYQNLLFKRYYKSYITHVFRKIGLPDFNCRKAAQAVYRFESKLATVSSIKNSLRSIDTAFRLLSKKETCDEFGDFDFEMYFKNNHSEAFDSIYVSNSISIQSINTLMSEESLENWRYYLIFSYIKTFSNFLDPDLFKRISNSNNDPIELLALETIKSTVLGKLLGQVYDEKHLNKESLLEIEKLTKHLIQVFEDRIKSIDWLSSETKIKAIEKLHAMKIEIGTNSKNIDFSTLEFDPKQLIANVKKLNTFIYHMNLKNFNENIDKTIENQSYSVGAFYQKNKNLIIIPTTCLQVPFYDQTYSKAKLYASIGSVISHEISHGFDSGGSEFDGIGSFKNWWTMEDKKIFIEKCQIFGETYAKFCPYKNHCVDVSQTMRENIADMVSLSLSYEAYSQTDEFKSNTSIHGFSPAQRFFISYSQFRKGVFSKSGMKSYLFEDNHSPWEYRVNGTLMNFEPFFNSFHVIEGDAMRNPKEKIVRIW